MSDSSLLSSPCANQTAFTHVYGACSPMAAFPFQSVPFVSTEPFTSADSPVTGYIFTFPPHFRSLVLITALIPCIYTALWRGWIANLLDKGRDIHSPQEDYSLEEQYYLASALSKCVHVFPLFPFPITIIVIGSRGFQEVNTWTSADLMWIVSSDLEMGTR